MKKKKRELDNKEVLSKVEKSRVEVKKRFNSLIGKIDSELKNMTSIKEKYELNRYNSALLNDKKKKLTEFKEKLIDIGIENIKEEL
ncbi:hypothetical protein AUJ84_04540 [Candidatus Pacearchaeota archaeon CG1_02_32_132]|nr:MAG: hypothetical protein AUJ84_04540 [Candidatus Pacearchaeota archaeon CG1_02_32_132]